MMGWQFSSFNVTVYRYFLVNVKVEIACRLVNQERKKCRHCTGTAGTGSYLTCPGDGKNAFERPNDMHILFVIIIILDTCPYIWNCDIYLCLRHYAGFILAIN